jgi:hypothetical protein
MKNIFAPPEGFLAITGIEHLFRLERNIVMVGLTGSKPFRFTAEAQQKKNGLPSVRYSRRKQRKK